eukprot:5454540-Alexandrium_andersonii.AAC.1
MCIRDSRGGQRARNRGFAGSNPQSANPHNPLLSGRESPDRRGLGRPLRTGTSHRGGPDVPADWNRKQSKQ